MSGAYGNENLAFVGGGQYLTVDGTSDTITIPSGVEALDFYSDTDCWVFIGEPGATPTAAAPGAEKTGITGFFLPAFLEKSGIPIPRGTDQNRPKIAAIQDTASGTLHVTYRRLT
jgi:hypothetical protein